MMLYGNWIISALLLAWGVMIKIDEYSHREANRLYQKWRKKNAHIQ